jgi:transcriptional regulator of acetoin/glycerol metabolism
VLQSAGSLEQAARTLGVDPATLYRKRKRLGLSP